MAIHKGVALNDFLDAWFEVRPRIYNTFFNLHDGRGGVMAEELISRRPNVAQIVSRRAELVRAKRLAK